MENLLKECTHLAHDDVYGLIQGRYLALRVSNFYDVERCDRLARQIMDFDGLRAFKYATHMQRFGLSLGEVAGIESGLTEYLELAAGEVVQLRELCSPYLTPIDKLRLALDEAWTAGANLATIRGRKAFTGGVRIVHEGGFTSPHQDLLAAPNMELSQFVVDQLAANIYLQTSPVGGALELWNLRLDPQEYQAMRSPGKVGVVRDRIRSCDLSIMPRPGDLILFRSTRLHAIQMASGGPRVTCATFIGYNSEQRPLVFYC